MEYISGLLVAVLILFMAYELIRSAVNKIIEPEPIELTALVVAILVVSILVKLYMTLYNRKYARLINSEVMRATASDAASDMVATSAVLAAALISRFTGLRMDGWCGLLVGLFVLYSGIQATSRTISTILGKPPEQAYIDKIRSLVLSGNQVMGVHDIVVHDYGPGRSMVSLHAEIPASDELLRAHAMIDRVEKRLEKELGCEAVIHIDPKRVDDKATAEARALVSGILYGMDPGISIHDFRLEKDGERASLSFDITAPYELKITDDEIARRLRNAIAFNSNMELNVHIDRGDTE